MRLASTGRGFSDQRARRSARYAAPRCDSATRAFSCVTKPASTASSQIDNRGQLVRHTLITSRCVRGRVRSHSSKSSTSDSFFTTIRSTAIHPRSSIMTEISLRALAIALLAAAAAAPAAADTYTLDPNHTHPSMEMSHMGYSIWRGKFNRSSGKVTYDPTAHTGSVDVQTDSASIDWGQDEMDKIAQTADWLDVAKYPTMTYSGPLVFDGDKVVAVDGKLTLRGVTKPMKLTVNSFKCAPNPYFKKFV